MTQNKLRRHIEQNEFEDIYDKHKLWLKTNGEDGQQADFSNLELTRIRFDREYLNLHKAIFFRANLKDCVIRYANFEEANFEEADLTSIDLISSNLACSNLRNAILINADLRKVNFAGTNLEGADLEGADLSNSFMCKMTKYRTYLDALGIEEENVKYMYMLMDPEIRVPCYNDEIIDFEKITPKIYPRRAYTFTTLRFANLRGANLTSVDLSFAYLYNANLENANLSDCNLYRTNFHRAILRNAILQNSNTCETIFRFADLEGANMDEVFEEVTSNQNPTYVMWEDEDEESLENSHMEKVYEQSIAFEPKFREMMGGSVNEF
ncbi:MAG TPA: pentapeptide repeat-containing protein [Clostridia bacterium]|nr:pentapeptide repeat-containing protein [Clostridia bacterium]